MQIYCALPQSGMMLVNATIELYQPFPDEGHCIVIRLYNVNAHNYK